MSYTMNKVITAFTGDNAFLDNDYTCRVNYNGVVYNCVTTAYLAQKLLYPEARNEFSELNASEARGVISKLPCISEKSWNDSKDTVLLDAIRAKFEPLDMQEKLKSTEGYFIGDVTKSDELFEKTCSSLMVVRDGILEKSSEGFRDSFDGLI